MQCNPQTLALVDEYLKENQQTIINTLIELITVPSISGTTHNPQMPFGQECLDVLKVMEQICQRHGFDFINHENYCGSVRWGNGAEEIGILAHLDVVPAGNGWTDSPFTATVKDGFVMGRGSADNKNAAVIGLFALDCMRKLGINLNHAVRLFLGCSEEEMMEDAEYYGKTVGFPKFSLAPDSIYPAAYAEKGVFAGKVISNNQAKTIIDIKAGVATNVVADRCEVTLPESCFAALEAFNSENISVAMENGFAKLVATGLSAHASQPEKSLNAIVLAFDVMLKANILQDAEYKTVAFWHNVLCDVFAKNIKMDLDSGDYGVLTLIGGLAGKTEDGKLWFGFNCRYPANDTVARLLPIMEAACKEADLTLVVEEGVDGFYRPVDDKIVGLLTEISNEILKRDDKPILMRAATYCRVFPNALPFGPVNDKPLPFKKGWGGIHQPDEVYAIDDLMASIKIYIAAILELDAII